MKSFNDSDFRLRAFKDHLYLTTSKFLVNRDARDQFEATLEDKELVEIFGLTYQVKIDAQNQFVSYYPI